MTIEDFNEYEALVEKPIRVKLNDEFTLFVPPVPSSGVLVSMIIRLMNGKAKLM